MTTTEKLISLAAQIAWRQVEFARLKQEAGAAGAPGVTVYTVRPTRVRGYARRGFRAVRVTKAGKTNELLTGDKLV